MENKFMQVTVFLASGKTFHFKSVKSCEEVEEYNDEFALIIHYHGEKTGKDRAVRFSLMNDNIIGYAVDEEMSEF
ncbi:hypothetical protein [Ligilactobacillus salivarius]|uniref:Uncharacterized protein n=1 Tax=Ligilactobacillus salivarius TaxID=1624 RepID=A0A1V9QNG5_9LACO|nr:hypothetical protein [Ligilactobacillus salivarius]OQQ81586.1 hypothetical protein B6U60_09960 [Ligilactobacillus salivarius]OQQ82378.1 hypothetical protein B6U59_10205 [Ligilactobacillus salivarius]